jgi:hypothetical protein
MNMFQVQPTAIDERHYTSGQSERHQRTSPTEADKATNGARWDYQPNTFKETGTGRVRVSPRSPGASIGGVATGAGVGQASSLDRYGPAHGYGLPYRQFAGPTTGAAAVANAKAINNLQQVDKLAKAEEADGIKAVDDKTFYLCNGVWVDSAYTDKMKPEEITFGTDQYFDLLHNNPGIAKYLAVGKEVIFVFNGHTYKIVAPATS